MKIILASIRGTKTPWADEACADYARRTRRHFGCEEVAIKAEDAAEAAQKTLTMVPARGWLIALDERGRDLDSEAFARLITEAADSGVTTLVFAIGGAYGHAPELRARARIVVRVSAMVLNHAVARVVLAEQVYRACTIRAGEPYHHGG